MSPDDVLKLWKTAMGDSGSETRDMEDRVERLRAAKNVADVAAVLGPESTREKLLPLCTGYMLEEEEEVQLVLAEKFGNFDAEVGGPDHAYVLIEPLKKLLGVEETLVRQKATEAVTKILKRATPNEASATEAMTLLKVLKDAEEWFCPLSSLAAVLPAVYSLARRANQPEALKEMLLSFNELSGNEMPMVREALTQSIGEMAQAVDDPSMFIKDFLATYTDLTKVEPTKESVHDKLPPNDYVRVLAGGQLHSILLHVALPALHGAAGREEAQDTLNQLVMSDDSVIQGTCHDASWRVRNAMAKTSAELVQVCKKDGFPPELQQIVLRRVAFHLGDAEVEVQMSAVKLISAVAEVNSTGFVKDVLPTLREFLDKLAMIDPKVVKILAKEVMLLFRILKAETSAIDDLFKLMQECIGVDFGEGRERETFEVKLCVMGKLSDCVVHAPQLAPKILDIVKDNIENSNWRVRRAVIFALPEVTRVIGEFEPPLLAKYLAGFNDSISKVREACAEIVAGLRDAWSIDWVFKNVLDTLESKSMDPRWCVRWVRLKAYAPALDKKMSSEVIGKTVEIITRALDGEIVPNIRILGANMLALAAGVADDSVVRMSIRPALESLSKDTDADVQFFGDKGLSKLG